MKLAHVCTGAHEATERTPVLRTACNRHPRPLTEKLAPAPAPASTTTPLKPALSSCCTVVGVSATLRSPGWLSRGMPAVRCWDLVLNWVKRSGCAWEMGHVQACDGMAP